MVPEQHEQHKQMGQDADNRPGAFPIVGIGASAGGLEAYEQLLSHLPGDTGMGFVLVQHLDPHHESRLVELLARYTAMPIANAAQGEAVRPNHVYVIPPNVDLALAHGRFQITPRQERRGPHLPIDYFFRSLAGDQKSCAVGVVLSGTGSDGAQGLCEIKAAGGFTFAQDQQSAKYSGMPHSAAESGCADLVMPPEQIARRLAEIGSHPYLALEHPAALGAANDEMHYRKTLTRLRAVTGVDFGLYRDSTIKRRIMRRMALHTQESLAQYVDRLDSDDSEVNALYHDLLINVTSFFRDAGLFDALKEQVFPAIVKGKRPLEPVRVWTAGCSTGQEAYSLAISLIEFFDDQPNPPALQIFATDISDTPILERARNGVYPESIEAEVSPDRLRRFFQKEDHSYRIDKTIRDMCVFARHNLLVDPPFSHVDLISCRNVLIYLAAPLQKRLMPIFHYALNVPGFLVLGSAESVGDHVDLFEPGDRLHKIYAKKPVAGRPSAHFTRDNSRSVSDFTLRRAVAPNPGPADFQREADRVLSGRYAPPGVLVDENLNVIQFRGYTGDYLQQPPGEPTNNLLKMARDGLFLDLRAAVEEARREHTAVRRDGVRVRANGGVRTIGLEALPIKPAAMAGTCVLLLFHEAPDPAGETPAAADATLPARGSSNDDAAATQLQRELTATKEYLQALLEKQDVINEELRSANEEIMSSNEELQSTNEELETAKEELQSTNEELITVNEQLQSRNLELNQLNNDLSNLLASIAIPVVMVGPDLRIRRFTQAARRTMTLLANDIGRPLGDLKTHFDVPDLDSMIHEVIDEIQVREREIQGRDGRWHTLRIHPYRTTDRKIDGAV
ncbi:MAG TPA: chemotaxis protein CheB, partial [Candidatus Binatia bacterium]|nr:chemotaxis protein CheB [Candidatus Binatia bacterium]